MIEFKFQSKDCYYEIECALKENGYYISIHTNHTCKKAEILPCKLIDKAIRSCGPTDK